MKKITTSLFLILFAFSACTNVLNEQKTPVFNIKKKNGISLASLLKEMTDREQITQFPDNAYACKQASSYNRESVSPDLPGWFADSDGEASIRTEVIKGKKEWVLMEDEGPGAITKIWAVCFYYGLNNTTGANIKFYLDGNPEPVISTNFFKLVKGEDFVKAPFADASTRAGNLYLPIPFAKSCKITMDQKAFYNIINYRKYPAATSVKTFTMEDFEASAALRKTVAKELNDCPDAKGERVTQTKLLNTGEQLSFNLPKGNGALRQFEITLDNPADIAQALRSTVLTAQFDSVETVWVPLGDFFNNVGKLRPYDMWERSVTPNGKMICRWVMPYEKEGAISVKNLSEKPVKVEMSIISDKTKWTPQSMHFYAGWQMDPPTPTFPLYDWNFLDAEGKGVVVGDQWTVLNPVEGWWGEGDEKIYIDDDIKRNFPSHFGTGTEDYYGWAGGIVPTPADEFAKPFLGNIIVGEPRSKGYNVCTRTRVLDAIPFRKRIKFDIESSCGRRSKSHFLQYAQTTFWYGSPGLKHNKNPLPERAAAKLPLISDLQLLIDQAKAEQYVVEGALEAEILSATISGDKVVENFAKIPMWGEISDGAMKNVWFENPGDFIELKITEQFEASKIKLCAALGPNCGTFDIYVNGQQKTSQNLYSKHEGMTNPLIDLGDSEPVDNAFVVKFVFKGNHPKARSNKKKFALGLDYFILKLF